MSSSAGAIYNGSGNSTTCKPRITNDRASHSFGIDRFLADHEQRCPPEFGKTQSPAEAEAAAEAQMTAKLLAFEKQFNSSDKQPGNEPESRNQQTAVSQCISRLYNNSCRDQKG